MKLIQRSWISNEATHLSNDSIDDVLHMFAPAVLS